MTQRIDLSAVAPGFYKAMIGLEQAIHEAGIDPALYELVKIRASQININGWNRLAVATHQDLPVDA